MCRGQASARGRAVRKIDYGNMTKVDRMVALGLMMLADNPQPPRWNESNPKTAKYVKAWRENRTASVQ